MRTRRLIPINLRCLRWRRIFLGAVAGCLSPVLIFHAAVLILPYPQDIDRPRQSGTFIEDRRGQPLAAFVAPDGQWQLPLHHDQISPHLLHAIIAVEDSRFLSHHGVDWHSAAGSLWQDIRHLRIRRGGSTLTMQLQHLRDPQPRTILNKFLQAVRAEQVEKKQTKDQILLEYLDRAPFGGNLVGVGAASWRYFGRPCRDLSLAEAALLAGLPQSPNRLRPDRHPVEAKSRRDHVLDRMLATGVITQTQHDDAVAEPVNASWRPFPQDRARGLLPTLIAFTNSYPCRTARTFLDAAVQDEAFRAATERLHLLQPSGVNAAAVVVVDTPTGDCLATVSVSDLTHRADLTRAKRSTGSTLKPLIYAAAFDAGISTPESLLNDAPAAWPGYLPGNYDGIFRGPMPAAEAIAESRNIPALLMLQKVGVSRATGVMASFGLRTLAGSHRDPSLSLAIGGAEATPLEMAEAYATLARGGLWKPVRLIADAHQLPARVMREEPCWQVMRALSGVDRTQALAPEAAAHHVAWKTGTSSGHRDAWCAAVTPRRTVVVWIGNPDGQGATSLIGTDAAAPLALQLIASLDPLGPGWPAAPDVRPASPRVVTHHSPRLEIASPERDQKFVLLTELRPDQQRIKLEASSGTTLWWFVDDAPAGNGRITWWAPSAGRHCIRVVNDEGQSATANIDVRAIGS